MHNSVNTLNHWAVHVKSVNCMVWTIPKQRCLQHQWDESDNKSYKQRREVWKCTPGIRKPSLKSEILELNFEKDAQSCPQNKPRRGFHMKLKAW